MFHRIANDFLNTLRYFDIVRRCSIYTDDENKILYVEIPKAGCTSLKTELFFKPKYGLPKPHENIHRRLGYKKILNLSRYKNYFKFTVTRDPYARFLALFNAKLIINKVKYTGNPIQKILDSNNIQNPNDLLTFINKKVFMLNAHICPQYFLLPKNLHTLDFIGQIENMDEVNKVLSANLGKKIVIPHLNKKGYKNTFPIDKDLFNFMYRKDYEIFKDRYKPLS